MNKQPYEITVQLHTTTERHYAFDEVLAHRFARDASKLRAVHFVEITKAY